MAETTAPLPMLGLRYDLRTAPHTTSTAAQYQACIEQCVWAEKNGFTSVTLSEHHSSEDGYLPSPMQIAGVIAGRTHSLFIMIGALLAPLYDPMRLAEDMAVLDLATGGRVGYILVLVIAPRNSIYFIVTSTLVVLELKRWWEFFAPPGRASLSSLRDAR